MTPPYSLEQAKYLCSLYQRLIGTRLDGNSSVVEDVLIIPFDQASKQRFMLYYMVMSQDAQDVVLQEYKGFLFDITVVLRNAAGEIMHKELATFLGADAIAGDAEGYSAHTAGNNNLFFSDAV